MNIGKRLFVFMLALGVLCNVIFVFVLSQLGVVGNIFAVCYLAGYLAFGFALHADRADEILDLAIGTRSPSSAEMMRLEQSMSRLKAQAKEYGIEFPEDVRLRMFNDQYPNAMAFGSRTVAISTGLVLNFDEAERRAVIAHEIGHLVHHDTHKDLVVLGAFGPLLVTGMFGTHLALMVPFMVIFFPALLALLIYGLYQTIKTFKAQKMEYRADEYAVRLTRDNGLQEFFEVIEQLDGGPSGHLFAHYFRSHPPTALRADRVKSTLKTLS